MTRLWTGTASEHLMSQFINSDDTIASLGDPHRWRSYLVSVGLDAFLLTRYPASNVTYPCVVSAYPREKGRGRGVDYSNDVDTYIAKTESQLYEALSKVLGRTYYIEETFLGLLKSEAVVYGSAYKGS